MAIGWWSYFGSAELMLAKGIIVTGVESVICRHIGEYQYLYYAISRGGPLSHLINLEFSYNYSEYEALQYLTTPIPYFPFILKSNR